MISRQRKGRERDLFDWILPSQEINVNADACCKRERAVKTSKRVLCALPSNVLVRDYLCRNRMRGLDKMTIFNIFIFHVACYFILNYIRTYEYFVY